MDSISDRDRNFVMCRDCGEFVVAVFESGELHPATSECPSCGNDEFIDIHERGT